jgi:hypothetical protein
MQLAVLAVLDELLAASAGGAPPPPALMFITGQGLKKRAAPVREVTLALLTRMGVAARMSQTNTGTVIVAAGEAGRALERARRAGAAFDVRHCDRFLVDPRDLEAAVAAGGGRR